MSTPLIIVCCLLALGYYAPRLLLWWVRRKVEQHMEDTVHPPQEGGNATAPSSKRPIGEDEGEYVEYEDVKDEPD